MLRDFTDAEARRALRLKWGSVPTDVLPAWVAEMDYALAPPVQQALESALADGVTGYPSFGSDPALGEAYAGFADRHYQQLVDPANVLPVVDVTAGVRVALDVLSEPGPMVFPLPGYHPQLDVAQVTGRPRVDLPLDPSADRAEIDLDGLDAVLAAGAQTVLLTQPHNPWGRVFSRAELEAVRDLVLKHGARVISDEIHGPLVLPGKRQLPYLALPGTADHAVAIVAASKAFNVPGLRCAQIVTGNAETRRRLLDVPMVRNDSWSPLGEIAAVAAYNEGDEWLAALLARLNSLRTLLADLLAEHLPLARMRPIEATYLAWIDLRAYGLDDPATAILERGRVKVAPGQHFQPGLPGHIRLNFATSPERLTRIITQIAKAL